MNNQLPHSKERKSKGHGKDLPSKMRSPHIQNFLLEGAYMSLYVFPQIPLPTIQSIFLYKLMKCKHPMMNKQQSSTKQSFKSQ